MNTEVKFISNPIGKGHWEVNDVKFDEWSDANEYALELESE